MWCTRASGIGVGGLLDVWRAHRRRAGRARVDSGALRLPPALPDEYASSRQPPEALKARRRAVEPIRTEPPALENRLQN